MDFTGFAHERLKLMDISKNNIRTFEEMFVLSRRRAAVFIYVVGVTVLALLFIVRIDVETVSGRSGAVMRMVEKTPPVFIGPVKAAIDGGKAKEHTISTYEFYQRNPVDFLQKVFT